MSERSTSVIYIRLETNTIETAEEYCDVWYLLYRSKLKGGLEKTQGLGSSRPTCSAQTAAVIHFQWSTHVHWKRKGRDGDEEKK